MPNALTSLQEYNLAMLILGLENLINSVPTGELRNTLTEANILLHFVQIGEVPKHE